ncbi:MAG TPA: TfoX/Sxy family protein [Candidatus Dormibacteraeota bacterium]|nr:TfoX/Sxy family protein [Candidatus Dormibacteraeota bacterium]
MSPMTMPKPSEQAKAAFQKLVPADPAVASRPMFGNLAAFVNGNMFCGLFGEDLFVRVSDADQAKIRKQGGRAFEPMPGRAMTGYVVVPAGWQKKPDATRAWVITALSWSRALPAKASRTAKKAGTKKATATKSVAKKSAPARRPR